MKISGFNFSRKSKPSAFSSSDLKTFVGKVKANHLVIMAVICLVPIALLFSAASFFGRDLDSLFLVLVLICPLMHFLMMRKH